MAINIVLNGGLGNQLFQYAYACALQEKSKYQVILDATIYYHTLNPYRLFELNNYDIKLPIHGGKIKIKRHKIIKILEKIELLRKRIFFKNELIEKKGFKEEYLAVEDNINIVGFFQSYKYFDFIRHKIIHDFALKKTLSSENLDILQKIRTTTSVSMHIRRGDFKDHGCMYILDAQYYEKAIKHLEQSIGSDFTLFIFSEDQEWVKSNLLFEQDTVFVDINDGLGAVFDLELMRNCKHNILSNSTLAWWGGYLNENKDKIIIAPKEPTIDKDYNATIYPENWTRIG